VKYIRHMLEVRHFTIFKDHKPITYVFRQKRDKCSPWQFNHLDIIAQFTTVVRHIFGQDNVVANTFSRVEFVIAPPSPTYWQHRRTATTNFEHFLHRTPPCGSRGNKFPAPLSPSTATRLPETLGRMFQLSYGSKCSSPFTICLAQHQSNSKAGGTAFRVARHTEGFPGLPTLQSLPPHSYSSGRLHAAGSLFPTRPYRPRGAPSNVSGLHILPHCN
jgi:hypothetical protein